MIENYFFCFKNFIFINFFNFNYLNLFYLINFFIYFPNYSLNFHNVDKIIDFIFFILVNFITS